MQQFEKFQARVLFNYVGDDERQGRSIAYIYNRESLNDLVQIKGNDWDNSQFISVGDILLLEGYKCEVKEINFRLFDTFYKISDSKEQSSYNVQIGVFVERING